MTLVDTSAWVEALRKDGDAGLRAAVAHLLMAGDAVLCDLVRLELWNGARGERERAELRRIETVLETIPTGPEDWEAARDLARTCRAAGITVPANDLLIAAIARRHGLSLLHADAHFDLVPA